MNYLKHYRQKRLMSQAELAEVSGVSQVQISFIETGRSKPMEITKRKLAIALGMETAPEKLFPGTIVTHPLRDCRIHKLMTQEELAKISGVSKVTISFIETGITTNPMDATKAKLSRALKAPVKQLFPD